MDSYLRAMGNVYATIVEESGSATYIAEAKEDASSASDAVWRVKRVKTVTSNGVTRTTVAWAGGHSGFTHKANNMASLSFADY